MTRKQKETKSVAVTQIRALDAPPHVVATHHPKIPNTSAPWSASVKDSSIWSNKFVSGLHTLAKKSCFALYVTGSGTEIAIAQEMSLALEDVDQNVLSLAIKGDVAALAALGYDEQSINVISDAAQDKTGHAPDRIDRRQQQMFFESDQDCVLVTPLISHAMSSEIALELTRRETEYFEALKSEKGSIQKTAKNTIVPDIVNVPHGGSNPQNAGCLVAKSTGSSRRGSLPAFRIKPPSPRSNEINKAIRQIAGAKSVIKIIRVDRQSRIDYARRSQINIDLAAHREAEKAHADDIAAEWIAEVQKLRTHVARGAPLTDSPALNRLPHDEIALLDPRAGNFDPIILARKIYEQVRRQIERSARSNNNNNGGDHVMPLSERSANALKSAFEKAVKCI